MMQVTRASPVQTDETGRIGHIPGPIAACSPGVSPGRLFGERSVARRGVRVAAEAEACAAGWPPFERCSEPELAGLATGKTAAFGHRRIRSCEGPAYQR